MSGENLKQALLESLPDLPGLESGQQSTDQAVTALLTYLRLLEKWNRSYNLTSIKTVEEMLSRHVLDSLSVLPWVPSGTLLDAGTGAGLPGVPLAIVQPELNVTLLDSTGKKIRFLNHVKRELKLHNTEVVQSRLESWETALKLDAIISRAFSNLSVFAEASRHLADDSTRLLAMKGRYPQAELDTLPDWVQVNSIEKLLVPGLQQERHLVIMTVTA